MTPLNRVLGALLAKTEKAKEQADRYAADLARTYLGDRDLAKFGPPTIHGAEVEFELRFAVAQADVTDARLRQRLDGAAQRIARFALDGARREAGKLGFATRWSTAYGNAYRLLGSSDLLREASAAVGEALSDQVRAARRAAGALDHENTGQGILVALEDTVFAREPVQWLADKRGKAFASYREGLKTEVDRVLEGLASTLKAALTRRGDDELDVIVDADTLSRLPEAVVSTVRLQFTLEEGEQAAFSATIEDED